MSAFITGAATAIWLGILTSISPCPLATNIAAISYIGKRVGSIRAVILSGVLYSFGRMLTYLLIGIIVVAGLLSIPRLSMFLQQYMNKILGPILILAGMFLLELLTLNFSGTFISQKLQKQTEKSGIWGAGLMGITFALSFCPVSAALFFGSLIPLAINHESGILLPSFYGIGTGLPVLVFAVLIAVSTKSVGVLFNKVTVFERWARQVTGVIFIGVGVYLTLKYIFKIL